MQQYLLCKKCKKNEVYLEHSSKYCRRCYETRRDANTRWATNHREKVKESTKKWRLAYPEKIKEYSKKAMTDPIRSLMKKIYTKEYKQSDRGKQVRHEEYKRNKPKLLAQSKEYYKKNKERMDESRKQWQILHPEKSTQYSKKYRENHPEVITLSSKRRRLLKKTVQGTFSKQEWESLCSQCGNKCLKCGRKDVKLTIDHIVPLSRGGTNSIDNLQPLCFSCNSSKGAKIINYLEGHQNATV